MTKTDKALVLLLRIVGVGSLFALVAVVMPTSWMAATHRWLGRGEMPTGPVVEYLARDLSAFYASPGTLFENCGRNTDVKNIIHGRCAYQPPPRAAFRDLPASSLGLLARLPSGRGRVGTRSRRRRLQTIAQLRRLPRQALHLA